ncbi:hypothetical protein LTR85_012043 [Meristemomyces frigidus]|nr:hypothetical protein LTR85_012043 [Meristemomyces frigidus]
MRATGFEPATREYQPRERESYTDHAGKQKTRLALGENSIFSLSNSDHGAVEQVLERAVSLGRRARDEEWTQERLIEEFNGFVKRGGKYPKPTKGKGKGRRSKS